jgi:hypothetical protein
VIRASLVLTCAALALTACGAHTRPPAAATQTTPKAKAKQCRNATAALARIHRDIAALKAAHKLPVKNELLGNKAINAATDKFLNHVELAPISNLQRNRLIDLAMSAIGTHCQQCFQALEAERPIPAIRAGQIDCSS